MIIKKKKDKNVVKAVFPVKICKMSESVTIQVPTRKIKIPRYKNVFLVVSDKYLENTRVTSRTMHPTIKETYPKKIAYKLSFTDFKNIVFLSPKKAKMEGLPSEPFPTRIISSCPEESSGRGI